MSLSGRFRWSRRKFLLTGLCAVPAAWAAEARWLEPHWLKTRRVRIGNTSPSFRLVHFTDIHHRGDRAFLKSVVNRINSLSPDFVCFTGDLVEESKYVPEALQILRGIKSPMYGVPGNHDYWSKASFEEIAKSFAATGGQWLMDERVTLANGKLCIIGVDSHTFKRPVEAPPKNGRTVVLMHYPAWVGNFGAHTFDLLLAGHSHGGQFRVPFMGPLIVPFAVDNYDLGLYHTSNGPMYVNPGIGWFAVPLRFNCRPELTVIEL